MAKTFTYKAKNLQGQVMVGSLVADREQTVAVHIREQGYFITQIKEQGGTHIFSSVLAKRRKCNIKEVAIFCRLFSTMIDAGLPLMICLTILIGQMENPHMKNALQDIYKNIKEGESLSRALSNHLHIFPKIMINMVEAGEAAGILDTVLRRLANHFEKEHKMIEKIKSAMIYPTLISTIAIISVVFFLAFILPKFIQIFTNVSNELPIMTQFLIHFSTAFHHYIAVIIAIVIVSCFSIKFAYQRKGVRRIFDDFILKVPVIGILSRKINTARFTRTLGTLLHSGVPILVALEIVQKALENVVITEALEQIQHSIREGISLSISLDQCKVFTPLVIQMVSVGEESGALDAMLEKIADFYESDVDDVVNRLRSIFEVLIIVILGIVIGVIIIAIMLPLIDIMTGASFEP